MFIKQAYEDRLQKENDELTASLPHTHSKAQPKIGSIKNTRINYDKDEHFFSKDDVPFKAQTTVALVKEEIDPDFLGLRKKVWNCSAFVPKNPLAEETFERKMIKIKLGMFDHQIPKYREPKIYDGCETRDYYSGIYDWNVHTQMNYFDLARDLERKMFKYQKSAVIYLKKISRNNQRQKLLIRNKYEDYKTGIDRQNELTMKLREDKQKEKEFREQIKQEYNFQNPSASTQKTDAAVFRIAYEKKHLKQVDDAIEFGTTQKPFYPNMSKTLKHKVTQKCYHSGVWQTFKAQQKVKLDPLSSQKQEESRDLQDAKTFEAWSCCMNQNKNSEGCCLVKKDKNRWNYESIKHY